MGTNRDNFKTWRMGLAEDSEAWQEMLVYGRELSMQPAETARVILVEWAQARRGRMTIGGSGLAFLPQASAVPPIATEKSTKVNGERERANATVAEFASMLNLDD